MRTPRTDRARTALSLAAAASVAALGTGVMMGSGQPAPSVIEHGVLTIARGDASFTSAQASAGSWQRIMEAAGRPPSRGMNAMTLLDTLVQAGWQIVDYEVSVVDEDNTEERFLLRRAR